MENSVEPVLSMSEDLPPPVSPIDPPPDPVPDPADPTDDQVSLRVDEEAAAAPEEVDLDIGSITGGGVSIQYLARLLVSRFLLGPEKGELVPDSVVRVSVKTLALSCMCEIILQNPQVRFPKIFDSDSI